mgnify:CR=1 FL=1
MKKVINCLNDHNPVINTKCQHVSIEEGETIAAELFNILNARGDGIGLAANQVGINASVAVVNVREPIVLINPEIIETGDPIPFYEGCLSFPKKNMQTKRYQSVIIQSAQSLSGWYFSGKEKENSKQDQQLRLLEAICVQHEIDHLNGVTIHDRQINTIITREKKIGRNELVTIRKGADSKVLKYKKAKNLINQGWTIE